MTLTRRQVVAGAALALVHARAQSRAGGSQAPRLAPPVCLYSQILARIEYADLPVILRGLGFDGCDLSVQPGGHVLPEQAGINLMPALEAITGAGLDVPVIATPFTSMNHPEAREVLGLAGMIGVPLFQPGQWHFTVAPNQLQREIAGLAAVGRAAGLGMAIRNTADSSSGGTVRDINAVIRVFDPRWVGFDFDPACAFAEGGADAVSAGFSLAKPRLKMATVRDFRKAADGEAARLTPCRLGEGIVDWPAFFALLAAAKFTGPVVLRIDGQPEDELAAIRQDLAFLKRQIAAAYRTEPRP